MTEAGVSNQAEDENCETTSCSTSALRFWPIAGAVFSAPAHSRSIHAEGQCVVAQPLWVGGHDPLTAEADGET